MSVQLAGRTAIVTGAASGIGRATVECFVDSGAQIYAVDQDASRLEEVHGNRPAVESIAVDLTAPNAPGLLSVLPKVDVLVNAAGILLRCPLLEHPLEDWQRTMDVNLRAVFRCSRDLAASWIAHGVQGTIINVCSMESFTPVAGHVAYTVSKGGLLMLTRAMALELAPHGIRVNGIAPGVTESGMNQDLRGDSVASDRLRAMIPMGRFAKPTEQADVIAFLASESASYIAGTVITVDGGWTAH